MSVIINGDTGITTPAETVQGALTTTGNTILGDATTDTLNVGAGGLVKDASGNVGIGRTPTTQLDVYRATGTTTIGANCGDNSQTQFRALNSHDTITMGVDGSITFIDAGTASPLVLYTAGSARMTLGTTGDLLVGGAAVASGARLMVKSTANDWTTYFESTGAANPYGMFMKYTAAAPNGTGNEFIDFRDSGSVRFQVRSNGGIANFSANNVNLSDERTKKDIVDAGNYLDKICAIPVRTFLYKDQTDTQLNLGGIAQEVEAVAPELVDLSGFGETPEDGVPLKAIYQTDLQYALMKSIQELKAIVDAQAVRIAALKA
jgi:hypothetical protein